MKIKNVLVTGASGKIGRSLVPALVLDGFRVRVTQFRTPVRYSGATTVKGSLADPKFVQRAMKGIDAVCHLATSKEDRDGVIDLSMRGTFHLLEQARARGFDVPDGRDGILPGTRVASIAANQLSGLTLQLLEYI